VRIWQMTNAASISKLRTVPSSHLRNMLIKIPFDWFIYSCRSVWNGSVTKPETRCDSAFSIWLAAQALCRLPSPEVMLPIRQSRTAGSEVTKEKEQYNAFIVQHVIRHLQFVHQVVAQVLRDVLVPVLPHTKGRGRLGCGHRTHASRVIHQPVVKGGREKKKGKD
jgi:hypothetical protein